MSDEIRLPGQRPPRQRRGPARVLFASLGWPCGVLEVASWVKHQGLAEVAVVPVQPGYAFRLEPDDRQSLAEGVVDGELVEAFARRNRRLSAQSRVVRTGPDRWEIRDADRGWTYQVAATAAGLDVHVAENLDTEALLRAVRASGVGERSGQWFLDEGGSPTPAARDALAAVGSPFLARLIAFRPHVVGFRLDGGQWAQIKRCIRAVRLFADVEIVLGGPTATSHPCEVLEESGADYVFAGEAEEPFCQFLRLAGKPNSRDLQPEIPGLAYRYGARTYRNALPRDGYERTAIDAARPLALRRLRELRHRDRPVASTRLIAANRLDWTVLHGFQKAELDSLFFTGGRGCPGACAFCARLHGPEVRSKRADQLLEEIEAVDAQVAAGAIRVARFPLFQHVADSPLRRAPVTWAAIYDEDFFLDRQRAIDFFRLWDRSPLKARYRLSLQTNPCSMLTPGGRVDPELLSWINRLKPMIQLGAESFNPELLARWRKRHNVDQLVAVLDALDRTGQDYTVFQLLTDFDTTPEELVETLRLLVLHALPRRRMRIASSPFTIPLYDSDTRRFLEYGGRLPPGRVRHFTDYERPQPGWMDPLAAELADAADAELRFAIELPLRDGALVSAFETVLQRIAREADRGKADREPTRRLRIQQLHQQAQRAMGPIRDARFTGIGTPPMPG